MIIFRGLGPVALMALTSPDLYPITVFFPFESERKESGHNPLAIPFSIPYNAYTKDPKSMCGNPNKCLANLGYKLLIIMLI